MIDASGVIPAGIARGNFQFMGDFDECLEIYVPKSDELRNAIHGQYCTLELPLNSLLNGTDFMVN